MKNANNDSNNIDNSEESQTTIISQREKVYVFDKVIGRGTFGVVYEAHNSKDINDKYAIKRYFRTFSPNAGQLEISILFFLTKRFENSNDRILKIHDGYFNEKSGDMFIITSYFTHAKFADYYKDISFKNLQIYMYELLSALNSIHKVGIIHRDVKPDNFLFDLSKQRGMLIDFGLAEADMDSYKWNDLNLDFKNDIDYKEISRLQQNNFRHKTGTKGFLAPEIIFHSSYQTTAVDIWAAGVILLCFLSQRLPVFNLNQFSKITDDTIKELEPLIIIFGDEKIKQIARDCQNFIYISQIFREKCKINEGVEKLIIRKTKNDEEKIMLNQAKDLLIKMLDLDQKTRITAEDALKHDFFKKINKNITN